MAFNCCITGLLCAVFMALNVADGARTQPTKEDFQKLFKSQPANSTAETSQQAAVDELLGTTQLKDAFVDDTLKTSLMDRISDEDKAALQLANNLNCSDGSKVFNMSRVVLKKALALMKRVQSYFPQADTNLPDTTRPPLPRQKRSVAGGGDLMRVLCWTGKASDLTKVISSLSDVTLQMLSGSKFLARLTDSVLRKLTDALPEAIMDQVCQQLKEADLADIEVLADKIPACKAELMKVAQSDPDVKEILLRNMTKRAKSRSDSLDDSEWDEMIAEYGDDLPKDVLRQLPNIRTRLKDVLTKDNVDEVMERVDLTQLNGTELTQLGDKLCLLPTSVINAIPKAQLREAQAVLGRCVKGVTDKSKKRVMAKKLLDTRDSASCKDFLANIDPSDEECWEKLSQDDVTAMDYSAFDKDKLDKLSSQTKKTLKERLNMNAVSDWSDDDVETYGFLLSSMGSKETSQDDVARLANVTKAKGLSSATFQKNLERRVFVKAKQQMSGSGLDGQELVKMKNLLSAMTSSEVRALLKSDVVINRMNELQDYLARMSNAARRALFKKISDSQMDMVICVLDALAKDVPTQKLTRVENLLTKLSDDTCLFQCRTKAQCLALYRTLVSASLTESPPEDPEDYQSSTFTRSFIRTLQRTRAICGMPLAAVEQLSPYDNLMDIAKAYLAADCENSAVEKLFFNKIQYYIEYILERSLEVDDITGLGPKFSKQMTTDDLNALGSEVKEAALETMKDVDPTRSSTDKIRQLAASAVKVDSTSGKIEGETVMGMGQLVCGLQANDVKRLSSSAILEAVEVFNECPLVTRDIMSAARDTLGAEVHMVYADMPAENFSLGGIAVMSDCQNLDVVSTDTKSSVAEEAAELQSDWKKKKAMKEAAYNDLDTTESQEMESEMNCGLKKLFQARKEAREQAAQSQDRRRRKRSTSRTPYTCEEIRGMQGQQASILSAEEIAALSADDFANCADTLCEAAGWTQAHNDALATKAIEAWGNPDTWADEVLFTSGCIMQGLSETQLRSLTLTIDHLESLGQQAGWTNTQLLHLFSTWLSNDGSVSRGPASISAVMLQQLGQFVCGATPQQINLITPAAYEESISDVGENVQLCTADQLTAWANVALAALGNVTEWNSEHASDVSYILAGLPADQLSQLSSSQLSEVDGATLSAIPADNFAAFSTDQLQSFSAQQTTSLTSEQTNSLSPDQRNALQNNGATNQNEDGSASGLRMAWEIIFSMTMAVLLTTVF